MYSTKNTKISGKKFKLNIDYNFYSTYSESNNLRKIF